jgi:hypothetical protein
MTKDFQVPFQDVGFMHVYGLHHFVILPQRPVLKTCNVIRDCRIFHFKIHVPRFLCAFRRFKEDDQEGDEGFGCGGGNDTMSQGNRRDLLEQVRERREGKSEREERETTERLESLVLLAHHGSASMARVRGY